MAVNAWRNAWLRRGTRESRVPLQEVRVDSLEIDRDHRAITIRPLNDQ